MFSSPLQHHFEQLVDTQIMPLQFIVAFEQLCSPASNAQFDENVSKLGGKVVNYLPDDAVLALLPLSSVAAVGQLPGAPCSSALELDPSLHNISGVSSSAAYTAGVAWLDEYQPEQRQSPELAALLQVIQQQGVQQVADTLQPAEGLSAAHRQPPSVELRHEPWHTVDIDHATDLAGRDTLLVSLDVMLVHAMVPLAAALSPQSKREAQARVLQVVSHGGAAAAVGDDAAVAAQTISSIQVSSLQEARPLEFMHLLAAVLLR